MIINIKLYKTMKKKMFTLWMTGLFLLLTTLGAAAQNSGTTGPLNWSYNAGTKTLSITGTGAMPDYASESDRPWHAFRGQIETVTIGSGVTTVGNFAFYNCGKLQNITLPEGVTTIGAYAFTECRKLDGITIPSTVTAIGKAAFALCTALPAIGVAAGNTHFTSAHGVLYNHTKTELVCYPMGKPGTAFTIPEGVKKIGGYAFSNCTLQNITLPEGLTTIGENAFFDCSDLKNIKIPGSVTSVENQAFIYCKALTDVTVAWDTPLAIDPNVFDHVTLSGITLRVPAGKGPAYQAADVWKDFGTITEDGASSSLAVSPASLDFTAAGETKPLTVTASGAWTAASDQTWLTLSAASGTGNGSVNVAATANPGTSRTAKVTFTSGSITREVNVTQAGTAAATLSVTPGTINITAAGETKPLTVNASGAWTAASDQTWLTLSAASGTGDGSVNVTATANPGTSRTAKVTFTSGSITREVNVTQAGTAAATNGTTGPLNWNYDAGTKTLSITGTGDMPDFALPDDQPWYAFQDEIETVTIGSGVTTVGKRAFWSYTQLQNITLPEGVTTIGAYAFLECHKLPGITIPSTVIAIGESAFSRCDALPAIGVAAGNAHFTSADGVLYNKAKTELVCYPRGKPGTAFTVPAGVKKIGRVAFYDCTLQSITLPEGLTTIRESAFFRCSALKSVKIPGSVTSVEYGAFSYCTALTDVTVAWNTPLAIESMVYYGVTLSGVTLKVPKGTKAKYQTAPVWKDFKINETTANQTIDGLRVYAAAGTLHLTLPSPAKVHIYNVSGAMVKTLALPAGDHVQPLPSGVYVVRVGERVTKILIK